MTQESKAYESAVMLPVVGLFLFFLVATAVVLTLPSLHIPRQLAARITISSVLSIVGCAAFIPPIIDLARESRIIGIVVYALFAALYAILAGMAVVYYWEPWVLLCTLLGATGIAVIAALVSDLFSRLPN